MNPNSTQSGAVNISVQVANPTTTKISPAALTATDLPSQLPLGIPILFGLVLHYLITAYALNNPFFPFNRNYTVPQKGFKATIWKLRSLPLITALLTGLYGLLLAKTIPIFIYNLVAWYFVFIEYILPRKK